MMYLPATVRPGGKSKRFTLPARYMGGNHRGEGGRSSNAHPCRDAPQLTVLPMVVKIDGLYNEPGVDKIGKIRRGLRMDFLKTVTGKILTGLVALAVIAAAISW